MAIDAISAVQGVVGTGYVTSPAASSAVGDASFAQSLSSAIDGAQALQSESQALAIQAVTGDLTDIHNATLASSRAAVTLELVAAIRNKGVDAFNEIMRMQA
ncbi:MAG TPA: flagellar hook-basal body complex protein FliE [Glaciihabitans sp.]|jgi:flagellar hook-basal body complex protein FliE|nr:flagellar hook-basal body complex protein FliE [Glaciihabitans sp.]